MSIGDFLLVGLPIVNPAAGLLGSIVRFIADERASLPGLVASTVLGGANIDGSLGERVLGSLGSAIAGEVIDMAFSDARGQTPVVICELCGKQEVSKVIGPKGERLCRSCFLSNTRTLRSHDGSLINKTIYNASNSVYTGSRLPYGKPETNLYLLSSNIKQAWPLDFDPPKWFTLQGSPRWWNL